MTIKALSGNEAVAQAMRQIDPVVVAAYPITPQTEIVQLFSGFVSDGLVRTEFVPVESEHSALSAVVGAAVAGVRAMTATSSNGLALMYEVLHIAAGLRLPIVMPVVTRALSAPINIHCDHSDVMGARDSGWIILFSENAQEAYDNVLQAVRIGEHADVRLPVMVALDGFVLSHGVERVSLLEDAAVEAFIGEYQPTVDVLGDEPVTVGALALQDSFFEFRRQMAEGLYHAPRVIEEVGREFEGISGRPYGLVEAYRTEDARAVLVALGSTAGSAKEAVDLAREEGLRVGLVKVRAIRPFPAAALRELLGGCEVVGVLDRSLDYSGQGGALYTEVKAALHPLEGRPRARGFVYGLGGREIGMEDLVGLMRELVPSGADVTYLGVRE